MADEAVVVVQSVLDHWGEGDFTFTEAFDPNVQFILGPGFPDAGVYTGVPEIAEYTRGFLQPWDRMTIRSTEVISAGDSVVTAVTQAASGKGSGVPADLSYFIVWTVRGGKLIRWENFRNREDAMASVGRA